MVDGTSIRRHTGGFTCRKVTFSRCTVFTWVVIVPPDPNATKYHDVRVTCPATAIQAVINLAAATPSSTVDLNACPLGDFDVLVGKAPDGDYRDEFVRLLDYFILSFDDADGDNGSAHRCGTLVRFCAEPIGAVGGAFCEAAWYDDDVFVGVFMENDVRSSGFAEQWLTTILDDVVASVPQLAPSMQVNGYPNCTPCASGSELL